MHQVIFWLSFPVLLGAAARIFYVGLVRGVISDRSFDREDPFRGLIDRAVYRYVHKARRSWALMACWAIVWLIVGLAMLMWAAGFIHIP